MQSVPSGSWNELPLAENLSPPSRPTSSPTQLCWRRICLGRAPESMSVWWQLSKCKRCYAFGEWSYLAELMVCDHEWQMSVFLCAGPNTLTSLGFQSRHAGGGWIWSKHHFFCVGESSIILKARDRPMRAVPSLKLVPRFCLCWKPEWFFSLASSSTGVQRARRHWRMPVAQRRRSQIFTGPFVLRLPKGKSCLQSCNNTCFGLIWAERAAWWVLLDSIVHTRDRGLWKPMSLKSYCRGTCSTFGTSFQQAGLQYCCPQGFSLSYEAPNSHLKVYLFWPMSWKCTNILRWQGGQSEGCWGRSEMPRVNLLLQPQRHKEGERTINTCMTFIVCDLCSSENMT